MSVSNLKLSVDKTTVDAGKTSVTFSLRWEGDTDYQAWTGDGLDIKGEGAFKGINVYNVYGKSGYYSFTKTVPENWTGDVVGNFHLTWFDRNTSNKIVTEFKSTNNVTLKVNPKELNFQVSLTPSNPTIKPGETAVFQPIITGVEAPYKADYKWTYQTLQIGGNEPILKIPYGSPGYEFVRCEVTITKDGYIPKTVVGDTKLTMAKGTLDNIGIMIDKVPSDLQVFSKSDVQCTVTGTPPNASVYYEWTANGNRFGTTPTATFSPVKPGNYDIQCTISVVAPDYDAITVSTPTMPVVVNKLTPDDLQITASATGNTSIGMGPATNFSITAGRLDPQYGTVPIVPTSITGKVDGGSTLDQFENNYDYFLLKGKDKLNLLSNLGTHNLKYSLTFPESEYVSAGTTRELSLDFNVDKTSNWPVQGNFIIDGKPVDGSNILNIKAAPGDVISFSAKNLVYSDYDAGTSAYKADLDSLSKSGKYELINKDGVSEVTAVDGIFTYTVPDELKTLKGKLRHTLDRPDYFKTSPLVAEIDIQIEIASNPLDPIPKLTIVQTPTPVTIGQKATLSRTFTDLPSGADITSTIWYINDVESGTGESLEVSGIEGKVIRNTTVVKVNGFDPVTVSDTHQLETSKKPWPTINVKLTPQKTTVPWGELIIAGFELIGTDLIEVPEKLTISNVKWYVDNNLVQSNASDGSFSFRATNPGPHEIKASVDLEHQDYGRKTFTQTFNMTTEPRDMATVLTLLPSNPTVQKDAVQKFTATVTGAPADATTTYKWEVDGVVQASVVNYLDFTAAAVGKNTIKVTSTTKAQDAADDVQTETTEITVTKKTMPAITATATATPTTIKKGETYKIKCVVSGQPAGATIEYKWNTGETTQEVTQTGTTPGNVSRKCTVTVKATDYTDYTGDSNTVTVVVQKIAIPDILISVTPSVTEAKVGDSYTVTAQVDTIAGATIAYLWNTGETSKTINVTATTPGPALHKCVATVSHADWLDTTAEHEATVLIEDDTPVIPEDCPVEYVHPLPHRNSAFIWAGWWVMDEIEKITKAGGDWKQPQPESKYKCHLATLAKMINNYPEVDVQESRNGRIVHRSALEVGIIY